MSDHIEVTIRPLRKNEQPLLADFLYEAIYQPEGASPLPREVIEQPELAVYIEDFGRPGDACLVAEVDGRVAGAVWSRLFHAEHKGYGTLDDHTPEISISLYPQYRSQGIGTRLLRAMLHLLREAGYPQVSLSVQKENPAARLYRSLAFEVEQDLGEEFILVHRFPLQE